MDAIKEPPVTPFLEPGNGEHAGTHSGTEALKRYFEHLFANSKDMMNLFSLTQGRIIMLNQAAADATGYTLEELVDLPIGALYPAEEQGKLAMAFERLSVTGYSSEKLKMTARSGELCDIWTRSYVVQREPEVICLVHTIDITEENRKRDREVRNAKLATLGQSSATLAHELKNALQSMQFSLGGLRNHFAKQDYERSATALARIERAVAHMDDVISGIEKSARSVASGFTHLSPASSVQNALLLMRGYLEAKSIEVTTAFDSGLPLVWADRTQLEQILIVLIKNAAQAMAARSERKLHVSVLHHEATLRIEVEDTGGGLAPEIEPRIFEAFATTKPVGLGLGLGLATARQLATNNGIALTFASELGSGTKFTLSFAPAADAQRDREGSPLSGRVVLLVGDEPAMLQRTSLALTDTGARVLVATSAPEGVQLLRVHSVEAVVCDDAMYPVTGRAFVQEARAMYRGPVCLVVNHHENLPAGSVTGVDYVLRKPLQTDMLVEALSTLVA